MARLLFVKRAFSEHSELNIDRFPSVGHFPADGSHKIHTRTQIKKKQVKGALLLVDNREALGHTRRVFMCACAHQTGLFVRKTLERVFLTKTEKEREGRKEFLCNIHS